MNQKQRDYLMDSINNTCNEQIKKLNGTIPDKPSLNNYLVASFLDNTVQFADINILKKKMRESVIKMGKGEILVSTDNRGFYNNREDEKDYVKVIPEDLFIIPEQYKKAITVYEKKKKEIEKQINILENTKKTIMLKLQIGSNAILEKLIEQVDNMGDLSLINTQLLIGDGK